MTIRPFTPSRRERSAHPRADLLFAAGPFVVSAVGVAALVAGLGFGVGVGWAPVAGVCLIFSVPSCVWVAVQWILSGRPPAFNLSPLLPSPEEREFDRLLKTRPQLSPVEFHATYYAETHRADDVIRLFTTLEEVIGTRLAGLHPHDELAHLDDELDWADVYRAVDRAFDIEIPKDRWADPTVTFDSLLDLVSRV